MTNPLISIIVPVYNAEISLPRAIESVINQSHEDWELILINDGSLDGSAEICEKFASKDNRIKVYHLENGGVSNARNVGIRRSTATYLTFLDADDYLLPDFIKKIIPENNVDFVLCGFSIVHDKNFSPSSESINLLDENSKLIDLLQNPYYLDTPWAKLFKREIILENNVLFNTSLRLSEDTLFTYEYLYFCNTVKIINNVLYIYDGVWGGTNNKYSLSSEELIILSESLNNAISALNEKFKINYCNYSKGFHLAKLKDLFNLYNDKEIYELYTKCHGQLKSDEFLGHCNLSPLSIALSQIYNFLESGDYNLALNFIIQLKKFFTTPFKKIHFNNKKHKYFYWMLRNFPSILLLRLCIFLKR